MRRHSSLHLLLALAFQSAVYAKVFTQESGKKVKTNSTRITKDVKHIQQEVHANNDETDSMSWLNRMVTPRMMRAESLLPRIEVKTEGQNDMMRASMMAAAAVSSSGEVAQGSSAVPLVVPDLECQLSNWDDWSACTPSCGAGMVQTRQNHILLQGTGRFPNCSTIHESQRKNIVNCTFVPCPVDCVWGQWSDWGGCSTTCSSAQMNKTREALQNPQNGGQPCRPSDGITNASCNINAPCPVDCQWLSWGSFDSCSQTCSNGQSMGIIKRSRNSIAPVNDGKTCYLGDGGLSGDQWDWTYCNTQPCPVKCSWFEWTSWTGCRGCLSFAGQPQPSNSRYRSPSCIWGRNAQVNCDNSTCIGAGIETTSCALSPCSRCDVSTWGSWSSCSVTCGQGISSQSRTLTTDPNNMSACSGFASIVNRSCQSTDCPQNCNVTDSDWSVCSVTCGTGVQTRSFSVAQPPMFGGTLCNPQINDAAGIVRTFIFPLGPDHYPIMFNKSCNGASGACPTPINCSWNSWADWDTSWCPTSCVSSEQYYMRRNRSFTRAVYGGSNAPCSTGGWDNKTCNVTYCSQDCTWSAWTVTVGCSKPCGGGKQIWSRKITAVENHGGTCEGSSNKNTSCNTGPCTNADCEWGDWEDGPCNATCGDGFKIRSREGENGTTNPCNPADVSKVESCQVLCPCQWSSWSLWSDCCSFSGQTVQVQNRAINMTATDGSSCDGNSQKTISCSSSSPSPPTCSNVPTDCSYDNWQPWSTCDSRRVTSRSRTTTPPLYNGKACDQSTFQTCCCGTPSSCPAQSVPCQVYTGYFTVQGSFQFALSSASAFVDDDAAPEAMRAVLSSITHMPVDSINVSLRLVNTSTSLLESARKELRMLKVAVDYYITVTDEQIATSIQAAFAGVTEAAMKAAAQEAISHSVPGDYTVESAGKPSFAVQQVPPEASSSDSGTANRRSKALRCSRVSWTFTVICLVATVTLGLHSGRDV